MAVSEQTPYQEFIANGTTTVFPLNFDAKEQDHLIVLVDDVEPQVGEWSFDFNTDQVTFLKAPKANSVIKIRRDTPLKRDSNYQTYNNSFRPEPVNEDLDSIWYKLQEMGVLNWMVNNDIKDLGAYVDSLNDETKAAFLAEIERQGISLNQLENLTNKIYQNLANIAVTKGWFAEFVVAQNGKNLQQITNIQEDKINSILDFDPNKDGITNDTDAYTNAKTKSKTLYLDPSEYLIPLCRTEPGMILNGQGATVKVDSSNGQSVVSAQFRNDLVMRDTTIKNKGVSLDGSRANIGSNSLFENVGFYNFKHDIDQPNAWGNYFKDVKNVTLFATHYGSNSQSDIAILEGTEQLTIINPRNDTEDGVYLNIEPNNATRLVRSINIIGGKFRVLRAIENSYLDFAIRSVNVIGAQVGLFQYRGAEIHLNNCEIADIQGNWKAIDSLGAQVEYAGALRISNGNLSKNYLSNPLVNDISTSDTNAEWTIYATGGLPENVVRMFDAHGYFTRLNALKNASVQVYQRNKQIIYDGIENLVFALRYRSNNNPTYLNYDVIGVDFFDSNDVKIQSTNIKAGRGPSGSNIGWRTDVSVFKVPVGAKKYQIYLKAKAGSSLDVSNVGVYSLTLNAGNGNFNQTIDNLALPIYVDEYERLTVPSTALYKSAGQKIKVGNALYQVISSAIKEVRSEKIYFTTPVNFTVNPSSTLEFTLSIAGATTSRTITGLSSVNNIGKDVEYKAEITAIDTVKVYVKNLGTTSYTNNSSIRIVIE